jgi:hypothetical protein
VQELRPGAELTRGGRGVGTIEDTRDFVAKTGETSRSHHDVIADRSKGRMSKSTGADGVHDIAKKSGQWPIVHCWTSE